MNKIILAGCVISDGGAILLLKRIKTGWYELPGGKVKEGEGIAETAAREVYEELRVNVDIKKEIGSAEFVHNDKNYEYHWFLAEIQPDQIVELGEPETHESFEYLPLDNLHNHTLSPNVQNFLKTLRDGNVELV
jgi:8-oxo-dGTP diphosphatase